MMMQEKVKQTTKYCLWDNKNRG